MRDASQSVLRAPHRERLAGLDGDGGLAGNGRVAADNSLASTRRIEVETAATPPTPERFSREPRFADCASAVTPSSPVVELLVARFRRDDVELGRLRPQQPELEAPATGLIDDLPAIRRDAAQRVDLIVMLAVSSPPAARGRPPLG